MKNPFPGMNPYLQQRWSDFQASFTVAIRDTLNQSLPEDLAAWVEECFTDDTDEVRRTTYPDARGCEPAVAFTTAGTAGSSVAVAEPTVVMLRDDPLHRDDPRTERHIEIVAPNSGGRVITAIKLLSPWNKTREGSAAYQKKQSEFLSAQVNLVEIDLVRGGGFVLAMIERKLPRHCRTPFLINVRRAARPAMAELYPILLCDPLPNIRIPLRPTDSDVVLQLQPLLDECYERGRYRMNYQHPPDPPLVAEDDAWADQLLRGLGLRRSEP